MNTLLRSFRVILRSRPQQDQDTCIRIAVDLEALDDVAAVQWARERMKNERPGCTWYAESVSEFGNTLTTGGTHHE